MGTGGSCAVSGSDVMGQITLVIGTSPVTAAELCQFAFAYPFASKPFVVLSPSDGTTNSLAIAAKPYYDYGTSTTSYFALRSGTTAPAAGTYHFTYTVGH